MKLAALAAVALLTLAALWIASGGHVPGDAGSMSVARALGEDSGSDGFLRADTVREFRFPEDHGAHPGYRNEWWYFTGNLDGDDGSAWGFQFVVFRIGLRAGVAQSASRWRDGDLYMAHFALTDVDGRRFQAAERFARPGPGLAGADADAMNVWLGDWRIAMPDPSVDRFLLTARDGDHHIELRLEADGAPVPNGERGLSRKSAEAGNASYYYSIPRLRTRGEIGIDGRRVAVTGEAWLDREWSTSALARDQLGWDWFALQLDDGSELMLYRLRLADGGSDPASAGTFVAADGTVTHLALADFDIDADAEWRSPASGRRYPGRWRIRVAPLGLELTVRPRIADQELRLTVTYWEGAVSVDGERDEGAVAGRGYVELAGY